MFLFLIDFTSDTLFDIHLVFLSFAFLLPQAFLVIVIAKCFDAIEVLMDFVCMPEGRNLELVGGLENMGNWGTERFNVA